MARTEKTVSIDEALAQIVSNRPPERSRSMALEAALGHKLFSDVFARTTLPSANVSAMDGFAVRMRTSIEAGTVFDVIDESAAGDPSEKDLSEGAAVRISTGAMLPEGADHVILQEQTDWNKHNNTLRVLKAQNQNRHIRFAGIDFKEGDLVLHRGVRLGPADIGLAAAANHTEVDVVEPLRVAIITNGNELRWPGQSLSPGEIVNSNFFTISSLCRSWQAEPVCCEITADNEMSIANTITNLAQIDVIVTIGGASVGDHDLMKSVLGKLGVSRLFDRVALRPGKPTWLGKRGNTPVLGLPGNPVAAFVAAHLFLGPLLGFYDEFPFRSARIEVPLQANGDRASFVRAVASYNEGQARVRPLVQQDTSLISSLSMSNCLLYRPAGAPECAAGDQVLILWTIDNLAQR